MSKSFEKRIQPLLPQPCLRSKHTHKKNPQVTQEAWCRPSEFIPEFRFFSFSSFYIKEFLSYFGFYYLSNGDLYTIFFLIYKIIFDIFCFYIKILLSFCFMDSLSLKFKRVEIRKILLTISAILIWRVIFLLK